MRASRVVTGSWVVTNVLASVVTRATVHCGRLGCQGLPSDNLKHPLRVLHRPHSRPPGRGLTGKLQSLTSHLHDPSIGPPARESSDLDEWVAPRRPVSQLAAPWPNTGEPTTSTGASAKTWLYLTRMSARGQTGPERARAPAPGGERSGALECSLRLSG